MKEKDLSSGGSSALLLGDPRDEQKKGHQDATSVLLVAPALADAPLNFPQLGASAQGFAAPL